jgi:hypothetical protein
MNPVDEEAVTKATEIDDDTSSSPTPTVGNYSMSRRAAQMV